MSTPAKSHPSTAEQKRKKLRVELPAPAEPFGVCVEAVQTGHLLFLTGMLPTAGRGAKFVWRLGAELNVEGRATPLASQRLVPSLLLTSAPGRPIGRPALCGWASQRRLRKMFVTIQRSPTARRNCSGTSWQKNWKSFSKWRATNCSMQTLR
jgi:hypothetical protein